MKGPIVEHVAIRARDFEWYLNFFKNTMGMEITLTDPKEGGDNLKQVWIGNIQLQRDETYDPAKASTGQMTHIGLVAEKCRSPVGARVCRGWRDAEPRNWVARRPEVNEA